MYKCYMCKCNMCTMYALIKPCTTQRDLPIKSTREVIQIWLVAIRAILHVIRLCLGAQFAAAYIFVSADGFRT